MQGVISLMFLATEKISIFEHWWCNVKSFLMYLWFHQTYLPIHVREIVYRSFILNQIYVEKKIHTNIQIMLKNPYIEDQQNAD